MIGWVRHPAFGPVLILAALGWGTLVALFLALGPGLGGRAHDVLAYCFGWDRWSRTYRLDAVLLVTLQPPLFAAVAGLFYLGELQAFLGRLRGRALLGGGAATFLAAVGLLLATGTVGAGAPAPGGPVPIRDGRPAPRADLADHRGQPFTLGAPLGRPLALTFIYGSCHAACPALIAALKAVEAAAGDAALFAAVTLDPERDDVAALAAAAARWELGPRWRLLTGRPDRVQALLAGWPVGTWRRADGEIAHENLVVLLDNQGRRAFTYRGLGHPVAELTRVLEALAGERS